MDHSSDMPLIVKDYGSRQGQKGGDRLLIRHRFEIVIAVQRIWWDIAIKHMRAGR